MTWRMPSARNCVCLSAVRPFKFDERKSLRQLTSLELFVR
jgi:hypothetical protein